MVVDGSVLWCRRILQALAQPICLSVSATWQWPGMCTKWQLRASTFYCTMLMPSTSQKIGCFVFGAMVWTQNTAECAFSLLVENSCTGNFDAAYVRSLREGNFQLYLESLTKIVPWMFALDHTHYSRWLPVHIQDITLLSENHPGMYDEFCAGKFVVHKTSNKFSTMAIDQCHEQNNAVIRVRRGCWTDD